MADSNTYETWRDRQKTVFEALTQLRNSIATTLTFSQDEKDVLMVDLEKINKEALRNDEALTILKLPNIKRSYYATNYYQTIQNLITELDLTIRQRPLTITPAPRDPQSDLHFSDDRGLLAMARDNETNQNAGLNTNTPRPQSPVNANTLLLIECDKIRSDAEKARDRDRAAFAQQFQQQQNDFMKAFQAMQNNIAEAFSRIPTAAQPSPAFPMERSTGAIPKATSQTPKIAPPTPGFTFAGMSFPPRTQTATPTQPNIFSKSFQDTTPKPTFGEGSGLFDRQHEISKPKFDDSFFSSSKPTEQTQKPADTKMQNPTASNFFFPTGNPTPQKPNPATAGYFQPSNDQTPMSDTHILANMFREVQLNRIPMQPPLFPKTDPHKNFHTWDWGMKVYEETNPLISDHVKIQHLLKVCEESDAWELVSQFSVATDSYATIMKHLRDRYMVPRIILSEFVERAIAVPSQPDKVQPNDKHLRVIVDTFRAMARNVTVVCKESLSSKGIPNPTVDQMNVEIINGIYSTLIYRVLNDQLRTHLSTALHLQAMELPDYNQLLNAIERRFVASQGAARTNTSTYRNARQGTHTVNIVTPRKCLLCPSTAHETSYCPKLINRKTFEEKRDALKNNKDNINICWICLDKPYGSCDCLQAGKSCSNCGGKHHKVMCYAKPAVAQANAIAKPAGKGKKKKKQEPKDPKEKKDKILN